MRVLSVPFVAILFLFALMPSVSSAREYKGVIFSESAVTGNAMMTLVGIGLRKKLVFDIYLGALYLEEPARNAAEVISSDQPKRVILHFLYRNLDQHQLINAWNEGFRNNASGKLPALKDRIAIFNGFFSEPVKTGETITVTYLPGEGTSVTAKGKTAGVIPGKDFMEALFSIWFGQKPPSEELKRGMLGGKS